MPSPTRILTVVTPANSLWLVSLDAALDELGLTSDGGTKDSHVGRMIGQVSAAASTYCNRVFVRQSYRDQFRGVCWLSCGAPLVLSQMPIAVDGDGNLVLTASEDGTAVDAAEWEVNRNAGTLYRLDSSGASSSWSGTVVLVEYDAGFDLIPDDVQAAALRWLTLRHTTQGVQPGTGGLRTDEVPGVQRYDYFQTGGGSGSSAGVPPEISEMLGPYRIWSI